MIIGHVYLLDERERDMSERVGSTDFQSSALIETGKDGETIGVRIEFFEIDQIAEALR